MRALQGRGHEVTVIQVLSPDEVNPEITGDLKLIDIETGIPQDVTVDEGMRDLYISRLQAWQAEISAYLHAARDSLYCRRNQHSLGAVDSVGAAPGARGAVMTVSSSCPPAPVWRSWSCC